MAKGNLNPADAFRKAQRKKELKKNKAGRQKARDLATVKKDTSELEDEIKSLGEKDNLSAADTSRLGQLNAELEKINKKKEEYVQEHPEQRNLVYRRRKTEDEKVKEKTMPEQRNLFNKRGLPRHPERSIYYDPVMNPYGVPPPGMPYMERPLLPGEAHSDQEDDEDDIALPKGLRPRPNEELVNSDDDIPMPDGPYPSQDTTMPLQPAGPQPPIVTPLVPLPPLPNPSMAPPLSSFSSGAPVPPPPPGFPGGVPPFPPPFGFPVPHAFPNFPSAGGPAQPLGIAPPGFFPRSSRTPSSMQDPLSSVSHTTYQAYQVQRENRTTLPSHPSLPPKPVLANPAPSATISAEPELRDLKKEATAFVPATIKRKRPGASVTPSSKVNAAPALAGTEEEPKPERPDLVSTLRDQFGAPPVPSVPNKKNDGYDKFMEEMGDILGS